MTPTPVPTREATRPALPKCRSCQVQLPLRSVATPELLRIWVCRRCGVKYRAAFAEEAPADVLGNAVMAPGQDPLPPPRVEQASPATKPPTPDLRKPKPASRVVCPPFQTSLSRMLDAVSGHTRSLRVVTTGAPFTAGMKPYDAEPYDSALVRQISQAYDSLARQSLSVLDEIQRGGVVDPVLHQELINETLNQATSDLDLFLRIGVNPFSEGYPARHSLHVAMLAVGMGAQLGWDRQTLVDLGIGCLLHDLGMTQVPNRVYERPETLGEEDLSEIARHPMHTFDLLDQGIEEAPLTSRLVVYQMHERLNGQGYPRRRSGPQLHEAAKVAAVADVYIALVSPRPHRAAVMPYFAVEYLLRGVRVGLFDSKAVRALLRAVSLFPIGSYVDLEDGRVGKVIRSNSDLYTRPVLETWRPGELDAPPEIVDLKKQDRLRVTRARKEP